MTTIPAVGTKIWASVVRSGMLIDVDEPTAFPVEAVREGYDSITFISNGREVQVPWATLVEVLGYFNP